MRAEVLLDEDHRRTCATTPRSLTDNEKAALYPEAAQAGMEEMSEKFKAMGSEVYVEAKAVKESNKTL